MEVVFIEFFTYALSLFLPPSIIASLCGSVCSLFAHSEIEFKKDLGLAVSVCVLLISRIVQGIVT